MQNYLEPLLLNMLFLIIFLLFIPHLIETNFKNLSNNQKKIIKIASALVAMISCMSFPFHVGNEIIMDLRTVAIIVSGLYLGRKASVVLVVIFLLYRFYLGGLGSGFYAAVIISIIVLICLLALTNVFEKANKQKRIIIACSFSLFLNLLVFVLRGILLSHSSEWNTALVFLTIHLFSTFIIVYFYEVLRETVYVNKQVIKSEKLEMVSHLASSISHEVRNPLTVVKGFLQMLDQKGLEEEKRSYYIKISLQEIERANDIIGNYLTFAKPTEQEATIINLKKELTRSIEIIKPMANMNCVDIQTNMDPCYINGDVQLLQQCLLNITKNCIEAMPSGGKLNISTKEIAGKVLIEITDNGEGMSDEQLRRIGEPYFTTKGRDGTGLGMMAAIKIIESMNGKFDVTSNINEGTQFRIYFPRLK